MARTQLLYVGYRGYSRPYRKTWRTHVLPLQVALVPYDQKLVDPHEILRVVAALQLQLTRDFSPVWGISGVVSAFLSLRELPPACIPLVIVPEGALLAREHGFHITEKGQPVGMIEASDGWSLLASHELLEIVCDPQGKRKVLGESLADAHAKEVVASANHYPRQGQVEYLLEICDPCQDSTYIVNGFQVSDFVTPQYYAPGATRYQCYSFTGRVTRPREVLNGGYITWYTSMPEAPIWQATRDLHGTLTVGPLTVPAPSFSRDCIDYLNDVFGATQDFAAGRAQAADTEALARDSAERYGRQLEDDVNRILEDTYQAGRAAPEVTLDDLLQLVERLATDEEYWRSFQNAEMRSSELHKLLGRDIHYEGGQVPTQEQFQAVYKPLKELKQRESGLERPGFSGKVATIAMQGTTT
jgi:hypothetical protein